ncbi:uncharacterized protein LOC120008721 [Tripterygium wilfordii]|uniref:uncharacterized protein LOC120008721 n=1 Tax=Tripterygium wilfordii TaxID=458696 RepID=UPI0018F83D70|nr:uncharacterized protein LOC120008721 [Tripterygium wilfordii]
MDDSEVLGKEPPPPVEDDRSTKKARFREEVDDAGPSRSQVSFRDKLMESNVNREEELTGNSKDLEMTTDDVMVIREGYMPSIAFSQKVHEQLIKPWKNTVVVKLLGRSIGYKTLCTRLESLWSMMSEYTVIDLENDYFLIKFKNEDDTIQALTKGPWTILGHYLTVQSWTPDFDCMEEKIRSVTAWIRLPGMPLHYYHKRILRFMGQLIGKVVKIDYNTDSAAGGKFARIAVQIELDKPLCSQFKRDGKIQNVEYECLPKICFVCGCFGHMSGSCPTRSSMENEGEKSNAEETHGGAGDTEVATEENPNFGPWMLASRKGKPRKSREVYQSRENGSLIGERNQRESRFNVLEEIEVNEGTTLNANNGFL